MTVDQVVMEPPTERQRELARRELAKRKAQGDAIRGRTRGPLSPEHRRKVSEGVKRAIAERNAAIEAVMREEELAAAAALQNE